MEKKEVAEEKKEATPAEREAEGKKLGDEAKAVQKQ
tara:strand:+ start:258 stop:365 length:108 start_codon:yes stop_codon:yes gene_type:complete